jgi:site-specific DNA recombinase
MGTTVAAIYARVSDDSLKTGASVAEQERLCRQLCAERGWEVRDKHVFVDNDVSATKGQRRPSYEAMLAALTDGRVDVIVAYRDDRLLRRLADCLRLIPLVQERGADICTVSQGHFDLNTAYGRRQALQSALDGQYEAERLAERTQVGMERIARQGRVNGQGRAFGYEPVWAEVGNQRRIANLAIVPSEAAEIVQAAKLVLSGEPLRAVVRDWRERVPTVNGGTWTNASVKRVLTAPRVAGLREHGTERHDADGRRRRTKGEIVAEATWPGILDRPTWERLCALLHAPGRGPAGPGPRKWVLRGLATCGKCGTKLITNARPSANGHTRCPNYVCPPTSDGGCGGVGGVADGLDAEVRDQVVAVLTASDGLARAVERVTRSDQMAAGLAEQIRADTDRLQALEVAHFTDGELSRAGYLEARAVLTHRIGDARRALSRHEAASALQGLPVTASELREWWEVASVERRRAVLDALIEQVVLRPAARAGPRFDPARVEIRWRT